MARHLEVGSDPHHPSTRVIELRPKDLEALGERGAFVREGFLGQARSLAAREEIAQLATALHPAQVGRGGARRNIAERGDEIAWLDDGAGGPGLAALRARFDDLGAALTHQAYLGLRRREIQVARYPGDGARYARHRDTFRDAAGPQRRVTAIVYLNAGWIPAHGGLLRLYLPGGPLDVAPRLDRLVVFLSERVEHEVLPAYAPRWAVTAWFYGP
jgi:SM-20-related protein